MNTALKEALLALLKKGELKLEGEIEAPESEMESKEQLGAESGDEAPELDGKKEEIMQALMGESKMGRDPMSLREKAMMKMRERKS